MANGRTTLYAMLSSGIFTEQQKGEVWQSDYNGDQQHKALKRLRELFKLELVKLVIKN